MKIIPVILSGGSGTRLWPVSRSLNPKQFLDFFGDRSLFQQTAIRVRGNNFSNPIIICNNEHRFVAAEELQRINIHPSSIILEPTGRNTAPAITIAALDVIKNSAKKDAVILVMPSDHIIENEQKFNEAIQKSLSAAEDGFLITFGITPDRPETGYGYIKQGKKTDFAEVFLAEEFIEKPKIEIAKKFLEEKKYLWNSGIFMFRASTYLEAIQKFQPDIFINCCKAYSEANHDLDFIRLNAEYFEKSPNISIDYAVMEKSKKVAVVPISVGWSDVGSWQAISDIAPKDKDGNSFIGDVKALKTKDCYINSRRGIVAAIGVKNLIIVTLKDAVLIIDKNNAQDVKEIFELLKKDKRDECHSHTKVLRPWGSFETIDIDDRFKVKRINVKPKSSLSLQMHNHRAEHWVIVKGTAHVTCGNDEFILTEDESTYIPVGKKHRLENRGNIPLEIIEVQTGSYLGEDDIIRFSDIYGRE